MRKFIREVWELAADVLMVDSDPREAAKSAAVVVFQCAGIASVILGMVVLAGIVIRLM